VSDIVKLLLETGASPNYTGDPNGHPPLHLALQSFGNDSKILEHLIASGADLMTKNAAGQTSLMIACKMCSMDFFMLIYSNASKLQELIAIQDDNGCNAFHYLADNVCLDHEDCVLKLCQQACDRSILNIGAPISRSATKLGAHSLETEFPLASPLERAIQSNRYKLAMALLKQGAVPYSRVAIVYPATSISGPGLDAEMFHQFHWLCTTLYEQCREEIITFGLHVYNPKLAWQHSELKDVFPLILPYLWYMNRLKDLITGLS
jgi:ankyrin repeat protein